MTSKISDPTENAELLSIVVPVFNEERTLAAVVEKLLAVPHYTR